uniref:Methyltransferase-like protein 16 n=1 Tax=Cacopsylla melanoneura TaxID=428564 RepID=A0A8D8YNU1_9HEMI
MSFNKYMHPRNRYVVPPNFKQLAIEYPEFRKHLQQDLSGKLKFNFHDAEALRIFSTTLLHKDFGLTVDIPPHCLVPTLPLRLNYILWIEDLLQANQFEGPVHGIDIGSGASCVYPLLACHTNSWSMLALECDPVSVDYARRNVQQNNLQELISVKHTSSSDNSHLESYLEPNVSYTFTMCNPPFFASSDDLNWEHGREKNDSKQLESGKHEIDCDESSLNKRNRSRNRNKRRKPPPNAQTGNKTELIAQGGEVSFVEKMIQDNIDLRQIKIFTTMLGHKSSFIRVKQFLMEHPLVKQVSSTEFCQGNTMRWGLAWTANEHVKLPSTLPRKESGSSKSSKPVVTVLEGVEGGVRDVVDKLLVLCDALQIIYKILQEGADSTRLELTAYQNTWSHQRRLKRKMKQRQENSNEIENKEQNEENGENENETGNKKEKRSGQKRRQDNGNENEDNGENGMKTENKEEESGQKRVKTNNDPVEECDKEHINVGIDENGIDDNERIENVNDNIKRNEHLKVDSEGIKDNGNNDTQVIDNVNYDVEGKKHVKVDRKVIDDNVNDHRVIDNVKYDVEGNEQVKVDSKVIDDNGNRDNKVKDDAKYDVEGKKNVKVDNKNDDRVHISERVDTDCSRRDMETKDNVNDSKIDKNIVINSERNNSKLETLSESNGKDILIEDNDISDRLDTVKDIGNSVELKADSVGNSTNKAASNDTIRTNQSSDISLSPNQISPKVPLVVCNVLIESVEEDSDSNDGRIVIEMIWMSGSGSRDLPHQIMQCFRNHL